MEKKWKIIFHLEWNGIIIWYYLSSEMKWNYNLELSFFTGMLFGLYVLRFDPMMELRVLRNGRRRASEECIIEKFSRNK